MNRSSMEAGLAQHRNKLSTSKTYPAVECTALKPFQMFWKVLLHDQADIPPLATAAAWGTRAGQGKKVQDTG